MYIYIHGIARLTRLDGPIQNVPLSIRDVPFCNIPKKYPRYTKIYQDIQRLSGGGAATAGLATRPVPGRLVARRWYFVYLKISSFIFVILGSIWDIF